MVCSNCVRKIPDGSQVCPRCGSAQYDTDKPKASAERSAGEFGNLEGDWAGPAPARENESGDRRGWEQTGCFALAYSSNVPKKRSSSLFSPSGRLNRLKYLYFQIMAFLAIYLLYGGYLFARAGIAQVRLRLILEIIYYVLTIVLVVFMGNAASKRLHDIDRPGYHFFLLLIPFYNIYLSVRLLFAAPHGESSIYGEYAKNSWYWKAPAVLLPLTLIYFAFCTGMALGRQIFASIG